jgi:hypothetical protein
MLTSNDVVTNASIDRPSQPGVRHSVSRRLVAGLLAILLLALGLRSLFIFGIYSFPTGEPDSWAVRTQVIALLIIAACQLGGGTLLRLIFRRPIPEIDRNEDKLDRCFNVLRSSLLFVVLSGLTAFSYFLSVRSSHIH